MVQWFADRPGRIVNVRPNTCPSLRVGSHGYCAGGLSGVAQSNRTDERKELPPSDSSCVMFKLGELIRESRMDSEGRRNFGVYSIERMGIVFEPLLTDQGEQLSGADTSARAVCSNYVSQAVTGNVSCDGCALEWKVNNR